MHDGLNFSECSPKIADPSAGCRLFVAQTDFFAIRTSNGSTDDRPGSHFVGPHLSDSRHRTSSQ
jgi:hypothetical protein